MTKRICASALALLITLCTLCAFPVFVSAEGEKTGSVTYDAGPTGEGSGMELLPIGSITDGKIVFDEAFSWIEVDKLLEGDADYMRDTAWAAQNQVIENTPDGGIKKMLNADGIAVWKDVPVDKVYLLFVFRTKSAVLQPSIFSIPMDVDGERVTDVTVTPKQMVLNDENSLGAVVLNKFGYENRRLEGAEFTLWEKYYYYEDEELPEGCDKDSDDYGTFYWHQLGDTFTTNEKGQIMAEELPFGDYRFIETKAPEGYITDSRPLLFTVSEMAMVKLENELYVAEYGKIVELNVENKIDPDNPPPYYAEEESEISKPEPSVASDIIAPEGGRPQLTSDDIKRYITVGAIVGLSLIAIIVLVLIGTRKKSDKSEK